jgi:hypothetical protein
VRFKTLPFGPPQELPSDQQSLLAQEPSLPVLRVTLPSMARFIKLSVPSLMVSDLEKSFLPKEEGSELLKIEIGA